MPSQVDSYLKEKPAVVDGLKVAVEDPREFSTFITVHKTNQRYLYCHLTRKMMPNDLHHIKLHVDGKYYRHKWYEWLRRKLAPKRKEIESGLRVTRRMIEYGKLEKMRWGDKSENNILDKGFLKAKKLRRIKRYSKLVLMSFKPLDRQGN